jgi:hypothetical protein
MNKKISSGTAHQIPTDLKQAIATKIKALETWESLTPLTRNEWICWVISCKQQKTRDEHIRRAVADLGAGERRPCCWYGCVHRKDKPMSASQRWVLERQTKKTR